jgi:hypothetical protein
MGCWALPQWFRHTPCQQLIQVLGWQRCPHMCSCGSGSHTTHVSGHHSGQERCWRHPACTCSQAVTAHGRNIRSHLRNVNQDASGNNTARSADTIMACLACIPPCLPQRHACSGRRSWDHPSPSLGVDTHEVRVGTCSRPGVRVWCSHHNCTHSRKGNRRRQVLKQAFCLCLFAGYIAQTLTPLGGVVVDGVRVAVQAAAAVGVTMVVLQVHKQQASISVRAQTHEPSS